jgi:hypothetical protein
MIIHADAHIHEPWGFPVAIRRKVRHYDELFPSPRWKSADVFMVVLPGQKEPGYVHDVPGLCAKGQQGSCKEWKEKVKIQHDSRCFGVGLQGISTMNGGKMSDSQKDAPSAARGCKGNEVCKDSEYKLCSDVSVGRRP